MELFDVTFLSRLQFAITVFFHFIFVPLTLGLTVLLAIMETLYVRTGNEVYKRVTKFWGKLFLINFALGVVTGITLEFQFGTNWSRYSEYVGDIFGSLLAIEATAAFFLESTFIAVWYFGWDKLSKRVHLLAIWLVAFAVNLSAFWIIMANGFMQNPVGFEIVGGRAELSDFLAVITNPYAWGQYLHTISASWLLSGFFVLGVSAWHLIRGNEVDFFNRSVKLAAVFTLVMAVLAILQGHNHGMTVAEMQPEKMAAMEAHWETGTNVPINIISWPDQENQRNTFEALPIPGLMSFIAFGNFNAEVKGLNEFPPSDQPSVLISFLSFRTMVALGGLFILLAIGAFVYRKNLGEHKFFAKLLTWNIPLPYVAIAFGWALAEIGRQPWIVYRLMRTSDASSIIPSSSAVISLVAFVLVYSVLGAIAIYLLIKYARSGPAPLSSVAQKSQGGK